MNGLGTRIRNLLGRLTGPTHAEVAQDADAASRAAKRAAKEEKRRRKGVREQEKERLRLQRREGRKRVSGGDVASPDPPGSTTDGSRLAADRALFYPGINYETHAFYRDVPQPDEAFARQSFERYVTNFTGLLKRELTLASYVAAHSGAGPSPPSPSEPVADRVALLRRRGLVPFRLSDSDRQALIARTADAVRRIDQRRAVLPAERRGVEAVSETVAHATQKDDAYEFFGDLLARHDIFETCQRYYGYPFKLKLVRLQINEASDRGIDGSCRFPDGTRSTMFYLHLDSTIGRMKIIAYRSGGVTASTGAFRFYPGSHAVLSSVERCIRKANDRSGFELVNDEARAGSMALPPEFRFKANFGNDLLAAADAIAQLAAREHVCDLTEGDLLLFDSNVLHRGAIFDDPNGRREILQLVLIPDLD